MDDHSFAEYSNHNPDHDGQSFPSVIIFGYLALCGLCFDDHILLLSAECKEEDSFGGKLSLDLVGGRNPYNGCILHNDKRKRYRRNDY